ncbi:hypothetical protein CL176_02265 [Suicoccus acidiformans]|uniref:DUF5105 domain-containing protein n=1 Tax=Suicoccus acidiformans TaxID=2036206 RepID=A0A347WIN6_9LACT|nr:hypothetical protein [Suicoccus acidiformans]AXY24943.1 hypothetical protein CL176_02265 [Suicoccus acidiformans]
MKKLLLLSSILTLLPITTIHAEDNQNQNEVSQVSELPEDATPQEIVEHFAKSIFGDNLKEVKYDEETGYIEVDSRIEIGGLSLASSRRGFEGQIVEFMEAVKDLDFELLRVSGLADMTDKYGNTELSKVAVYPITKETIDKINYDKFILDNLEELAEGTFIHPEFR